MQPLPMNTLPDPDRHAEFYLGVPTRRALAWVLDSVLTAVLTLLVLPFTAFTGLFFLAPLYMTLGFFYRWGTMASASATPGMRFSGLVFLDRTGARLDAGSAFLHTAGYTASVVFVMPQLISVVLMLISARKQGLTDHVLGTVAINRPARN